MYTPTDWRRVWRLPGEADSGLGVWTLFWVGKRELLFLRPWGAQGPASPRLPHLGAGTRAWDRALALIVGVCPGAGPPSAPSRAPAERNLSPLCCCEGPHDRAPLQNEACGCGSCGAESGRDTGSYQVLIKEAKGHSAWGPDMVASCRDSVPCVPGKVLFLPPTWEVAIGSGLRRSRPHPHSHMHMPHMSTRACEHTCATGHTCVHTCS